MAADLESLKKQIGGDEQFVMLLSKHHPKVFAYLLASLGDWHDAEEAMQATCVAAWQSFDQFEPGTNFFAWIRKIAFHRVLGARKKAKRTPLPLSDQFLESVAEGFENSSEELDDRQDALQNCMESLRSRDKTLIQKCYADGAVIKDIAEELGRPVGTVYKSLTRIRRSLLECVRRRLAGEGVS